MGDMPHIALMSKTVTVQPHEPFTQKQMSGEIAARHWSIEYYMGAKLIEVGVNPKSAYYRWSCEEEGEDMIWTYSAYWGELKEQMLQEKAAKQASKNFP